MNHGTTDDMFHTYPREEISALGQSAACQVLLPPWAEPIKKEISEAEDCRHWQCGSSV